MISPSLFSNACKRTILSDRKGYEVGKKKKSTAYSFTENPWSNKELTTLGFTKKPSAAWGGAPKPLLHFGRMWNTLTSVWGRAGCAGGESEND